MKKNTVVEIEIEIADRLLERLDDILLNPKTILDLSCNAPYTSPLLQKKFPTAAIINTEKNPVDLLFANLISPPENIFNAIKIFRKIVFANGLLLFTLIGNINLDMHLIGDALLQEKFINPVMDMEYVKNLEIVYGHAWGPMPHSDNPNEVLIPIAQFKL